MQKNNEIKSQRKSKEFKNLERKLASIARHSIYVPSHYLMGDNLLNVLSKENENGKEKNNQQNLNNKNLNKSNQNKLEKKEKNLFSDSRSESDSGSSGDNKQENNKVNTNDEIIHEKNVKPFLKDNQIKSIHNLQQIYRQSVKSKKTFRSIVNLIEEKEINHNPKKKKKFTNFKKLSTKKKKRNKKKNSKQTKEFQEILKEIRDIKKTKPNKQKKDQITKQEEKLYKKLEKIGESKSEPTLDLLKKKKNIKKTKKKKKKKKKMKEFSYNYENENKTSLEKLRMDKFQTKTVLATTEEKKKIIKDFLNNNPLNDKQLIQIVKHYRTNGTVPLLENIIVNPFSFDDDVEFEQIKKNRVEQLVYLLENDSSDEGNEN
ncbi:hypothetical protein M0812_09068 [Anaeramoeba flamelloides]|uniref:Uncharacterized protein n=1 Tax=Anaeramoeba flamelloides TaxID=1746091 RepID=A0AAV7ZML9_9EUKA|nr:hypothetical protein M0812_09068 [Anaeramoeba flamelloides]